MKNFLNISDINSEDLKQIVEEAKIRKNRIGFNKSQADNDKPLDGKSMIMILKNHQPELEYLST